MFLVVNLLFQARLKPFYLAEFNQMEFNSLSAIVMTYYIGLYYVVSANDVFYDDT